jgi:hypothetical protein
MAPTIRVDGTSKARLSRLRVASMTYDDVIGQLLEGIDEDEFRAQALRWQEDLVRRIRANPKNRRLS